MKRIIISFFIFLNFFSYKDFLFAQTAVSLQQSSTNARIIGEVVSINKEMYWLVIKTALGETKVLVDKTVICKRVLPEAKNLDGAETISFENIQIGDRVWVRQTTTTSASNIIQAKQIVVMNASSIAERNQRERDAWQRRGIQGDITAINLNKNEFTLHLRDGSDVILVLTAQTNIRRFPPGSVNFTASRPITLSDIKVGDKIIGRGERSADGRTFMAETIVVGDVPRPTFGQITAINIEKKEISVQMRNKEIIVIRATSETLLRKAPEPNDNNHLSTGNSSRRLSIGFDPEVLMEQLKKAPELKLIDFKVGQYVLANGPKLSDGKSINALFVLQALAPSSGGTKSDIDPVGGGFIDIPITQ